MPRFACSLVVAVIAWVGLTGCSKKDGLFCTMHPDDPTCSGDPMIDARIEPDAAGPCTDNAGCKLATAPVCDLSGGDGVCVTCTATDHALCTNTTPVCSASHACEACRVNADCPLSDLCLPTGACAAETDVAYVLGSASDNTACSKAMPCLKLMAGLVAVNGSGQPRPYIKVTGSLDEAITINRSVTILATPGAQLTRTTNGPILLVTADSVVEIDDLKITNSKSGADPGIVTNGATALTLKRVTVSAAKGNGISCAGASLAVSNSTITDNGLVGIECTKGSVTVAASTIPQNKRGGLVVTGTTFDIANNFLHHNGDKSNSLVGGASLAPTASPNHFEFNTVVDNDIKSSSIASAGVIRDFAPFTAPNNIISRNRVNDSTVAINANTIGVCTYPTSASGSDIAGFNFVAPDADPPNYHLQTGSSAIGAALTPTTLTTDVDGDARPQQGTNDQGADEFKPAS